MLDSNEHEIHHAYKMLNANNCWHFNIYKQHECYIRQFKSMKSLFSAVKFLLSIWNLMLCWFVCLCWCFTSQSSPFRLYRGNFLSSLVEPVLLDFSLTVKAATLIFISGCGSAISSAKEGKSDLVYNSVKSSYAFLSRANVHVFHENPNRIRGLFKYECK